MDVRSPVVRNIVGSIRAEGLDPGEDLIALADARAAGRVSDRDWAAAKRMVLAGESVERFIPAPAPAWTR
ncbi:hypothetical protein AB0L40_25615 [Patulibacter sp. NPDC049589]|uniref:hypothetical protein n=1 Tax=Patulibacter sp. NPDC049589 TaxID=3154731 RepID=UPI00343DADC8